MKRSNKGFTLIEMIIVLAVLAILATVAVLVFMPRIETVEKEQCRTSRHTCVRVYKMYTATGEEGLFDPVGTDDFTFLVDAGLLEIVPECVGGGSYEWQLTDEGEVTIHCSVHGDLTLGKAFE